MVGWWACEVTIILTYNKPFSAFWNEDQSGLTSNQLAEKRMKGCFVHAYNKLDRPMRRRSPYMGQWYTIQHGYRCLIWHFLLNIFQNSDLYCFILHFDCEIAFVVLQKRIKPTHSVTKS